MTVEVRATPAELCKALQAVLAARGATDTSVFAADGTDRPDLVVVDPQRGVFAIALAGGQQTPDRQPFKTLNRQVASLREQFDLDDLPVRALVVYDELQPSVPLLGTMGVIDVGGLLDASWLYSGDTATGQEQRLRAVAEGLSPSFSFAVAARTGLRDDGAAEREQHRVRLDGQQAAIARRSLVRPLLLTGPPGSGKTLVLAARARWLLEEHPSWTIQIVCFNRALAPYLRSLTDDDERISVQTFGRLAVAQGARFDLGETGDGWRDLLQAERRGVTPVFDALLVDEVQDLHPAWIEWLLLTVRPDRGSAVLAGDPAQGLYRDVDLIRDLRTPLDQASLSTSYRCTQPVLRSTSAISGAPVPAVDGVPQGEPVDVVWASNWNEQARAAAWEIRRVLDSGDRAPRDIGVLVTQRASTIRRLSDALTEADVPFRVIDRDTADSYDRDENAVTLVTVHSAKGHEFGLVILFGLEALPEPESDRPPELRRARVGYVGMTRARDQLLITYTRASPALERLRANKDDVRLWTWPDDYDV